MTHRPQPSDDFEEYVLKIIEASNEIEIDSDFLSGFDDLGFAFCDYASALVTKIGRLENFDVVTVCEDLILPKFPCKEDRLGTLEILRVKDPSQENRNEIAIWYDYVIMNDFEEFVCKVDLRNSSFSITVGGFKIFEEYKDIHFERLLFRRHMELMHKRRKNSSNDLGDDSFLLN
jgi:hypothetical protein